jgi:hypothetical protein
LADRSLADIEADMRERDAARMVATYGAEGAAGLNAHWRKVAAEAWKRTQKWLSEPLEHEKAKPNG